MPKHDRGLLIGVCRLVGIVSLFCVGVTLPACVLNLNALDELSDASGEVDGGDDGLVEASSTADEQLEGDATGTDAGDADGDKTKSEGESSGVEGGDVGGKTPVGGVQMARPEVQFDDSCIVIDRVTAPVVIPPAGLRLRFRVLGCDGNPIAPLSPDDVAVINDEKGVCFGTGLEGDSVSDIDAPSDYALHTVLALDLSASIVDSGAVPEMLDGARRFLEAIERTPNATIAHEVSIVLFGRPEAYVELVDFTSDFGQLRTALDEIEAMDSLGATDLYGAYMEALGAVKNRHTGEELHERFLVLMTDGTHESGLEEEMRANALAALAAASDVHVYTIGIDGAYDPTKLEELASTAENFVQIADAELLAQAFDEIAIRVDAVARSNYVVGVCTPVVIGEQSTLTIAVNTRPCDSDSDPQGGGAQVVISYPLEELTGDVACCNAQVMAHGSLTCEENVCSAGDCQEDWSECGNGRIDPGEQCDPRLASMVEGLGCHSGSCEIDYSDVPQLYCHEHCTWSGQFDCTQAEADLFCKLKTGNADAVAASYDVVTALEQPGFACPYGIPGVYNLGSFPELGIEHRVFYETESMLGSHGPGNVITNAVCVAGGE